MEGLLLYCYVGLPWVGLMMVHGLVGLVACVGRDIDSSCSLVFMSVCKSGGRNPVPYQESRAV